jgi:peptidoglycan hydrolase-like protein with peptidoglycan-binding domain
MSAVLHRVTASPNSPGPQPVGSATPPLARGCTGSGVRDLQRKLVALGYLSPEAAASGPGVFGPRTAEAVRTFQLRHGLRPSGVVGTHTQGALAKALGASPQTFEADVFEKGLAT